jgi:hypothetical protein
MTLYQHDRASMFRFEILGELRGPLIGELAGCWATALPTFGARRVVVDVTGVTSWDDEGANLLRRMQASGAEVIGDLTDRTNGFGARDGSESVKGRAHAAFDRLLTRAAR